MAEDQVALVVDMDGTLLRADSLHEAIVRHVVQRPLTLISLLGWLRRGKVEFKRRLADVTLCQPDSLPFNPSVIEALRQARASGRRTALVSAADFRQVELVARHCDLFDEVIGTGSPQASGVNLSGEAKAAAIRSLYGDGQYDYIGDSQSGIPVWASARKAFVVMLSPALAGEAAAKGIALSALDALSESFRLREVLRGLRPHQWAKNLLVLVPVLASHQLGLSLAAILAMVAFCLVSSSIYVINDIVDLPSDRAHPTKRHRPYASGQLSIPTGMFVSVGLLLAGFGIAASLVNWLFAGVLAVYLVMTMAYSLLLKRKLLVDILVLAGLYTLRIVAGSAATGIPLSPWMLAFTMFIFFSLAAIKRQSELLELQRRKKEVTPGRGYLTTDLPLVRTMSIASGQSSVLVFALYVSNARISELYSEPLFLWGICPVLFYWLSRLELLTHRGFMSDDPVVFAMTDRTSQFCIAVMGVLALLAATTSFMPVLVE